MPRSVSRTLYLAAFAALIGALVPGCACHEGDVLQRVYVPEISTPELEDPALTVAPEPEDPETADCTLTPTAPHCVPGAGIYVCNTCPGASDANPGTPAEPLETIRAGIERALMEGHPDVFVANRSAGEAGVYREHVEMAAGVSVRGRYVPGEPWTRTALTRTVVENVRAEGLTFRSGILRTTVLAGFEIRSAGAVGGADEAAAVSILGSSPTLVDVAAGELVPGAPAPVHSSGVVVAGGEAGAAIPLIKGVSFSARAPLRGGGGTLRAVALNITRAHVDVQYADLEGGIASAAGDSRGALFENATGRIRDSVIVGGGGGTCAGVEARGGLDGLFLEGNWITGCRPGGPTAKRGAGVVVHGCTEGAPQKIVVRANPAISGGVVPGGLAVGVAALDGCAAEIVDNPNVSGGSDAARAVGVWCSHQTWAGTAGRDSACTVRGNTALGGLSAVVTDATGIFCEGSCAAGGAACAGSCAELARNEANATAGLNLTHVVIRHASPLLRRNRIGLGGAGVACLHRTTIRGLVLEGSASRVENNFVLAGPCEDVVALVQVNAQRKGDGSWVAPDVHSNTLVGGGSSANTTGSSSGGVLLSTAGDVAPPPLGQYRNNIFVGGQNNHRVAFAEGDAFSDPAELRNNAFHNFYRSTGPLPIVYLDENASKLLTAGDIDGRMQPETEANLVADPVFVNTFFDFHLQPVSPLVGLGTPLDAPTEDLDGEARPRTAGKRPDIGADEL